MWVRPGWLAIANDAASQLAGCGVPVREVREKLGQLRIHVPAADTRRPDVQAIVEQAAAQAARTCDLCGKPGTFRSDGGTLRVRCDQHQDTDADADCNNAQASRTS